MAFRLFFVCAVVLHDTLKCDICIVHIGIPKEKKKTKKPIINFSIYENRQWDNCIALSGYLSPLSALIQIVTNQIEFARK